MKKVNHLQHETLTGLHGVIIFSLDIYYQYTGFTESHKQTMKLLWGAEIDLGQNILECIQHEDDRKRAQENFDKAIRGELIIVEEEYGDALKHVRLWWENRYSPIYDKDRKIVGITVFAIDITQRKYIEHALRTGEIHYRSIMDQASDGIFIADPSGRYVDVNPSGCELLGYTREEILNLTMYDIAVGTKFNPIRIKELMDGKVILTERELLGKNGKLVPVEISAKKMEDGHLMGIIRNIETRRQEEARVRFLAFVMDKISSAVISTDTDMKINYWNKSAENLYGWKEEEVLGQNIDEVCGTEFLEGQQELAKNALLYEKTWRGELKQNHRNGKEIWVDASVTLLEDNSGNYIGGVTINRDVTERKLAEDELRRTKESIEQINLTLRRAFEREQLASRTDSLTGVFNRRYFFELLGYEFLASRRYDRPLSIVMFDVDFLKKINDTYGHQVGDDVLKKAAEVVRTELRSSDVLARYGGDEFAILLSSSSQEEAAMVLERIYLALRSAYVEVGDKKIHVTISAGVSSIRPDMEKADQLVMLADQALYLAKNAGRNRMVIFDESKKIN